MFWKKKSKVNDRCVWCGSKNVEMGFWGRCKKCNDLADLAVSENDDALEIWHCRTQDLVTKEEFIRMRDEFLRLEEIKHNQKIVKLKRKYLKER